MQKRMKGELRKNQILDFSKKLFSEKGYYETYVEEVIKEARVGKGTFYRYFKNKEDLFISLLIKFLNEWEEAASIDLADFKSENINSLLKLLILRSFKFFRENEDLCNIYLRIGPGLNKIFEPYLVKFEEKMLNYIIVYLKEGIRLGIVRADLDIELAANIAAGAFLRVDYFYFVLNKNNGNNPADIEKMAEEFFQIIMKGIHC
ncbi:MAG TPA: TetR/AcrR family transcriptional regulator [Spirochaetota bacterium]|nr:TetR/AcrR family transcriptional regulator [Spirochaetota bacterium]HPC40492.1 TetR/AcrR family transcriptional regulator [Spirochaetota bacterium]HPL17426.1 TetR/AcrR family transcriptional regulator [Spirochaetota bacterium]HQF08000.1 TetR/AcrR family transcriptional regulator [Spirochaetota bacterium]HQH96560.1 TetR/AcrR family transcriptional regulator [Spirochaetota bacterium]